MFHVSQLKKCHAEMADIPLRDTVPLEAIQLDSDLTYEEKPVKILEFASRVTRSKVMMFCKVQWRFYSRYLFELEKYAFFKIAFLGQKKCSLYSKYFN